MALNPSTLLCNHYQHPTSEPFHLPQLKLYPLNNNSPLFLVPGSHHVILCLYEVDYSKYLIKMEWCNIHPFLTGLVHLAMSSRFTHVVTCVLPFTGGITSNLLYVKTTFCLSTDRDYAKNMSVQWTIQSNIHFMSLFSLCILSSLLGSNYLYFKIWKYIFFYPL